MRRKMTSVMLCIIMIAMAFFVTQPSVAATSVNKVKVIPVPWQEWRIVYDPSGEIVIGVDDIIFFDPPEMLEDAVAIVRWYVVLPYQIPLEDLTWEKTEILPWKLVDYEPYILKLNDEVHLFIPTEETDEAVLVRYMVAWASTPDVIESVFVNEALLESKSPQAIVGSLSNFEVHNSYNEPIDNFELELYGNIVPDDVLYVYDEPGDPYLAQGVFGPVWYGGWGVPPKINKIPGGIEIVWIDKEHPVQYCEWIHFGVSLRLVKKVKEVPVPVQFWQEFPGGVTDIIVFGAPSAETPEVKPEAAAIVRDYVVLPYQIPLEDLTWEGTEHLPWIPIDDPANPYILIPGEVAVYDIYTTEFDQAVLVRYTVAWENAPFDIKAHFVNEATLEPLETPETESYQVITGQLMNFDVHNDYDEPVDNFELELYGIQPSDIVGWYWNGLPPDPHKIGDIWYGGWGTPPHITWLPDGSGTEVLWMDPDHPVQPCEWVHFGLYVIPGVIGTGTRAYWTQLLNLTGAKAYLTQTVPEVRKVKMIPVPWQEWRIVYDPTGQTVIGVDDIIFFGPPEMPEDAVAIVRWYVVLPYQITLEDLTWEETEQLPWVLVDLVPYILHLNDEVHLFIPTEETDEAVLVRYTVAWESTPDVTETLFVNEALLENQSPQAIVGSLSNFEVHNSYNETIDNFELELYGNIVLDDVIEVYDEPGEPYLAPGWLGPVWLGGWGVPPEINTLPGGIEIVWIDEDHPVQPCEWIHFGVSLRVQKKVKEIPAPVQFWEPFPDGVTDIIVFGTPETEIEAAAIVRDYVVLPYEIPLELLTWEGTEHLNWIPIDDPDNPYILEPGESVEFDIFTEETDRAVLVRYTVAWEPTPDVIEAHFVNEATLEPLETPETESYQVVITGQLMNFDVHNDYDEPVDNFELELYGIQPLDIVRWYWEGMPPDPYNVGGIWYGGWGTPPHITTIPNGTEVLWKDPDHPVQPCEWVHFGLRVIPGVIGTGTRAYWTQLLNLTGAKGYLTQTVNPVDKYAVLICGDYANYGPEEPGIDYSMQYQFDEFWNDMVIMYWLLLENCYTDENIFFLYADGEDHPSDRYDPEGEVTDYAATRDNVNMVFGGLAFGAGDFPRVDDNDILVVYTFDHGGYIPGDNVSTLCLIDGEMRADEFAWSVGRINAGYKMFFMQQCFSGGFITWLEATNTVILTACNWDEVAFRADNIAGTIPEPENEEISGTTYHHGEFNFHFMNALRKVSPLGYHVPADLDGNCEISMIETFQWVEDEDSILWETPQYSDPGGIGDDLYLKGYNESIPQPSGKYAVLICGDLAGYGYQKAGVAYTSFQPFDEFWNDIVLMYWILLENGYTDENIIILYGDGVDYEGNRYDPDYDPNNQITDFAATEENVEMVFYGLAFGGIQGVPQMGPDDFLFVYTFDHGGLIWDPDLEDWVSTLCLMDGDMRADDFAWNVGQIDCAYKLFFMQQCHSGGFIEYLDEENYVVVTACDMHEVAWRADDLNITGDYIMENEVLYGETCHHGEFNYYFMNAFRKVTPLGIHVDADLTNDCRISAYESFSWVVHHDSIPFETTQLWGAELSERLHLCGYYDFEPTRWAVLVAPVRAEWELCLKDDISDMREYLLERGWDDDHIIFLTTETIGEEKVKLPKGEIEWAKDPKQGKKEKSKENPQDPYQDEWWIDGDATWQNVKNALDALEMGGTYEFWHSTGEVTEQTFDPADEDDIIYMSFKDHGEQVADGARPPPLVDPRPGDEADGLDGAFRTYGNPLDPWDPAFYWYDDEMDIELDQITYYKLIFEMMACHAGEFIPDCIGDMRLICLSCEEDESSYGVPPYYDLYDGLTQALTNYSVDDGFVSVEEAHQYEADTIPPGIPQHPISDDQIPGETKL